MIKYYKIEIYNGILYIKKIKAKRVNSHIYILFENKKQTRINNCITCKIKHSCPFPEIKNKTNFNACIMGYISSFRYYLKTKILKHINQLDYLLKG